MNCIFARHSTAEIVCEICGTILPWEGDPRLIHRPGCGLEAAAREALPKLPYGEAAAQRKTQDCLHRGQEVRRVACQSCGGKHVEVKVFACKLFGECTLAKRQEELSCCAECPEFAARSTAPVVALSTLPISLKSPRDRRPVWRGGVLQIWVTRACDKACFGCTQGSNLAGTPGFMTPEQFDAACRSLQGYFGVVGVFGGNPCLHPQFDELCRILRGYFPFEQRGLWSNNLNGQGATARITFNPAFSNLNVHQDQQALHEILRDWPEAGPHVKGFDGDSRHAPPYVALQDIVPDEAERWRLIADCDVNARWSAMIGVFRGELRAWFCELAGAQSMLHQSEPDYPDTGAPLVSGWWDRPMSAFDEQARFHCHACGIPLKGFGALANGGECEQVSETHRAIYRPKRRDRPIELVTLRSQLGETSLPRATDYIENGAL